MICKTFCCAGRHSTVPEPQEQIVTPFAQILHTLKSVHKNYMTLTNVSSNRSAVTTSWNYVVFTSAKQGMFFPVSVCSSVRLIVSRISRKVVDEFWGNFWSGARRVSVAGKNWLDSGDLLDHVGLGIGLGLGIRVTAAVAKVCALWLLVFLYFS